MSDSPWSPSRREILATLAAAGLSPLALGAPMRPASRPAPKMLSRAMRWVQLALVEKDPATFDPDWWLDLFKRVHADGACISAGGMCAFYPTDVPFHHRSEFLGDKDTLGYLVRGCRKLNMTVVARVDPHCIRDDAAKAHPEWVAVNASGQKARHMVIRDRWLSCALGPCNFEFMPQVLTEIVTRYGVDAIFANRWAGHITCYCESCLTQFKRASGLDAPRSSQEPGWAELQRWRANRLFEVWDVWDAAVSKVNPEACCLMNMGSVHSTDMPRIGARAGMVAADRQGRNASVMPPWAAGWNAKVFRSVMSGKPVAGISSIGNDDAHRWKDSVQSAAEIRIWLLECIASGMRPWVVKFCGTIYDHRWVAPVELVYQWHFENEPFLRHTRNLARVALLWSPQTSVAIGNARAEAAQLGFYHALVEARIPFEMVNENFLGPESLAPFKLLILPGIAALSDAQCDQIRQFVKAGGSVVATYETSLFDEAGRKRKDFALADLFGVAVAGKTEPFIKNSYIHLQHETHHPILHGLDDAGRIINTSGRVPVKPTADFVAPPLTQVPSYPDLPMEDVYPREPTTKTPEVFLREVGSGRVAYFPGDIDRTFWEVLDPDHGRVIANTVRWALNEPDPVTITGPGVIDVAVWQQAGSMTVHLVNLTNPMLMKGPIRDLYPVGPQQVSIRLPEGRKPKEVKLLVSKAEVKIDVSDNVLTLTIPSILDHEVVGITF